MKILIVITLLNLLCSELVCSDYSADIQEALTFFNKPRVLDRHRSMVYKKPVLGFSWSSCGSKDPVKITSLSVSPDPIRLPGTLKLSVNVSTAVNISAPVKLELEIKKKIGFWIKIPCVNKVGSCTYDNVCSMLPQSCPPAFKRYNLPCKCPLPQGIYSAPGVSVTLPNEGLPSFLTDGDFKVKASLSDASRNLACYEFEASVTKG